LHFQLTSPLTPNLFGAPSSDCFKPSGYGVEALANPLDAQHAAVSSALMV